MRRCAVIYLALGSNLAGRWGSPEQTLDRAIDELDRLRVRTVARSRWYRTAPYGAVSQGDYLNGVIAVVTHLPPSALVSLCHRVERAAGRGRGVRWGARTLDIDLVAYHEVVIRPGGRPGRRSTPSWHVPLEVPHRDLARRAFVVLPLAEIAPRWTHPVTGTSIHALARRLAGVREGAILRGG